MGTSSAAGGLLKIGLAVNAIPSALTAYASDTMRNVGFIESDTPPSFKRKVTDVPTLADGTLTFGGGKDPMVYEANIVRNFGDAAHESFLTDGLANVAQYRNFEIIYADSGTEAWRFVGFVSEYSIQERTQEGVIKAKITVNLYADPTIAP